MRVAGGQELRVVVEPPAQSGPAVAPAPVGGVEGGGVSASSSSAKTRKIVGGIVLGLAGAAAAVAGVTGGLALRDRNTLRDDYCDGNSCPGQQDALDRAHTRATLSTVFTCVSGAALVAGVLLVAIPAKAEGTALSIVPAAAPDGAGLSVEGRF